METQAEKSNLPKGRKIETIDDLLNDVSEPLKNSIHKIFNFKKVDLLVEIDELISKGDYKIALAVIDEKIKLPYSKEYQASLYFKLGEIHRFLGDLDLSLEAFKKARELDKDDYSDISLEILKNYLISFVLGNLNGDIEDLINREFINAKDSLDDLSFASLELDFVEIFNLLGYRADSFSIIDTNKNYFKLLSFLEYKRYLFDRAKSNLEENEKIEEIAYLINMYASVEGISELLDESYEKFSDACEEGNIVDPNYEDRDFLKFGHFSNEFFKKTYDLAFIYFSNKDYISSIKLLAGLIKYIHNFFDYSYYLKSIKLFSEIIDEIIYLSTYNKNININEYYIDILNSFYKTNFTFLKNEDYYILGNIYYGLGDYSKALSVYTTYYTYCNNRGEAIEKMKSFLELLMSNENLLDYKIKDIPIKNQYYSETDNTGKTLTYEKEGLYNYRNFAYYLNSLYEKVCNGKAIKI